MKNLFLASVILLFCTFSVFAQKPVDIDSFQGIWKFLPVAGSSDTTFESYSFFMKNKHMEITFWKDSQSANTYGMPYSYYGFRNTSPYNALPKHLRDLQSSGRYVLFYDDLIETDNNNNKIGYDKFGNLYEPTRYCDWSINEELAEGLPPTTINFNFGKAPDVYKKIDKIPDYVLLALKKNSKDWQKYLIFMEHKEMKINFSKSLIYSFPNNPTKMYLIKGDEVEILEENGEWLKIRYYGKKVVEGWIKRSDVE
ncbi:hypothetical protein ACFSMX_04885 [Flectobacillus roseus]|uniref:hypothetical protein n=1 Tax=Flectobacillus roseus TaxID=502259 RepID=UPI00362900EC